MARYEFKCNRCKEEFELNMSIKDRDKAAISCLKCKSTDVSQIFRAVNIIKSRSRSSDTDMCSGCSRSGCCE